MMHRGRPHLRVYRVALMVLASMALIVVVAPVGQASPLRRLDCRGLHYKGATVKTLRERYNSQLSHLACTDVRSLAKAYYDVATPDKRVGFRIPGFRGFRGYPGPIGGPIIRSVRDHFLVIKLMGGPNYAPSAIQR